MQTPYNNEASSSYKINSSRYLGKVQFLKQEHGYIRTKTKIQGLRDITFYYSDLPEGLKIALTQGTMVSFSLKEDDSGKFTATNIIIENPVAGSSHFIRSSQTQETSSRHQMDDSNYSAGSLDSAVSVSSADIFSDDEKSQSSNKGSTTISPMYMIQSFDRKPEQESGVNPHRSLDDAVNAYLDIVMSRNFNFARSSCWLF